MSLFSVFDPSTQIMSLNWLSVFLWVFIFPLGYWVISSRYIKVWFMILSSLMEEFVLLLGGASGFGVVLLVLGLFSLIVMNNLFGLVPYVFTGTAHFVMTISLAVPLWLGLMLYGWINHTLYMFAHLVPQGTPGLLLIFMVLIESISNLIRPLTLSVRLGANMIAGHLLLVLLGGQAGVLGVDVVVVLFGQIMLLVLELAVAVIQAYVFVTLMTLYFSEVNYDKMHSFVS
uniref:ATP synthase subunit a n=1 Tax=Appalachioria falcifera TaxID=382869 RepID=S4T033_APPFA|nr:ATP synthase F0 subunit 6 [Appalachioria falcifera]AFR77031.1 ATP synthetase F0 Subunit 6 [Appalachioria falcifera]